MDEKEYIQLLKAAGAELDKIRDSELAHAPEPRVAIEALSEAFLQSISHQETSTTSGLVELQKWLARLAA